MLAPNYHAAKQSNGSKDEKRPYEAVNDFHFGFLKALAHTVAVTAKNTAITKTVNRKSSIGGLINVRVKPSIGIPYGVMAQA